jgi:hypothetical protein
MSWVVDWSGTKSRVTNRKAHCKECSGVIPPGKRKITLSRGLGMNARTLYLCPSCADWAARQLRQLALELQSAVNADFDAFAEWYKRRDAANVASLSTHRESPAYQAKIGECPF